MATKPPAKPAAPATKEEAPVAAPPKSKKMLIIGIVVLLLGIVGGAAWFFTRGHAPEDAHAAEAKAEPAQEVKYVPLGDNFTVNLQREEGDQYLQTGVTLKILDPALEEKIKAMMPEIRSKLLFLLSSKKPSELLSVEGKNKLVAEIIVEVDSVLGLGSAPVHAVVAASASDTVAADAASAPAAHQETPTADTKTKGVVGVVFTTFIIQ